MMRAKPASAMQKTYDDCYLVCSTAVYFESQNNEAEALRSWKNALDQIYYHNAYRMPANYRPKTETERALQHSLRQMELQCKERVDLLEAIRQSKAETEKDGEELSIKNGDGREASKTPLAPSTPQVNEVEGWLASGTIQPLSGPDSSRPPPLPQRPELPSNSRSSGSDTLRSKSLFYEDESFSSLTPITIAPQVPKKSRTPSPEKRGMLRTLRPLGKERTSSSSSRAGVSLGGHQAIPAAKAASQAWGPSMVKGKQMPSPIISVSSPASTLPTGSAERSRNPESNILAYRKEYIATRIDSKDAIERARRKHGFSIPCNSSSLTSRPKSEPKHARDTPAANPALSRNRGHKGNRDERDIPSTAPSQNVKRRPVPASSAADRSGDAVSGNHPFRSRQSGSSDDLSSSSYDNPRRRRRSSPSGKLPLPVDTSPTTPSSRSQPPILGNEESAWNEKVSQLLKKLPKGVDEAAARQIFNEIVVHGDVVHWDDVAGLDIAKSALKENVVYPFLRPDLFMGLREPARGMLLFGPPGTGKTMLARAVATESHSTFFAISASSLTSKFLGESEKLVRALFALAKALAPSIIFVDEIDSLLSARGDSGEHEATRRIKTEFLIQWSDLARAAAGREQSEKDKEKGDASRVLVLAATNLPWAIDEAARRRFVRRQYIPLPEGHVRASQLRTLLSHQKHTLTGNDIAKLVRLSEGFSGSDITALAKDAAMGPLRSLGEKLLHMSMDEIRPMGLDDFLASLQTIRPSVSKQGLQQFEDWAKEFGERGG